MRTVLSIVQIVLCLVLIAAVMLQPRKHGRGGIFGGATMADSSANQWARFSTMSKITVVVGSLFMINSLALIIM